MALSPQSAGIDAQLRGNSKADVLQGLHVMAQTLEAGTRSPMMRVHLAVAS
jgi:hypothetical protein